MTIENLNEMERAKIDLEEVIKKYVKHILHVPLKALYIKAVINDL